MLNIELKWPWKKVCMFIRSLYSLGYHPPTTTKLFWTSKSLRYLVPVPVLSLNPVSVLCPNNKNLFSKTYFILWWLHQKVYSHLIHISHCCTSFLVSSRIQFKFMKVYFILNLNKNRVLWSQACMRIQMRLRCYLDILSLVICNLARMPGQTNVWTVGWMNFQEHIYYNYL